MRQDAMGESQERRNFFISYTGSDRQWAEWIALQLETAGYTLFLQAWDFRPGSNFVAEMDNAAKRAERVLLVLSPAYLRSEYAFAEWAVAFRHDPKGMQKRLLPVRIEPCEVEGLLGAVVYIDLVSLDEVQAKERLLAGVMQERVKPTTVAFPGQNIPHAHTIFPGSLRDEQKTRARERETISTVKALFLAANPASTPRLAIDEEMYAIERKVRAAEYRDVLIFQSAWAVRSDDLLQLLNQHRPQIVHFSGHGNQDGLSLAGANGRAGLVTIQALTALFATLKDNIRLVFLNACYSREQAQALVAHIDCVVGMKESIHDDAAAVFASSFYRAIGFGRSIQEAFDQGRTALLLEGIADEDIPELVVKDGIDPNQVVLIRQQTNPR